MKFSKSFERDWEFYFSNKDRLNFDPTNSTGNKMSKFIADEGGQSAKECFYAFDSSGKAGPCREIDLLRQIFNCKASVNFHIKMWAEGRAEMLAWVADKEAPSDVKVIASMEAHQELKDIQKDFGCPEWVTKAIVEQATKIKVQK